MFSKDDILKQLRAGANAQDIAQDMADNINAAIQEFEEEKKATEAVKVKRADARAVIDVLADFFGKYFDNGSMNEAERDQAVDAMIELTDHMRNLEKQLKQIAAKTDRAPSADEDVDDDALLRFLKTL